MVFTKAARTAAGETANGPRKFSTTGKRRELLATTTSPATQDSIERLKRALVCSLPAFARATQAVAFWRFCADELSEGDAYEALLSIFAFYGPAIVKEARRAGVRLELDLVENVIWNGSRLFPSVGGRVQ